MTVDRSGLILVFSLVAALIALQVHPPAAPQGTWRPLLTYRVDHEHPVSFHVPPGTAEIKLIALAEPLLISEGPVTRQHYVLEATWRDETDDILTQTLSVHAGRSAYPTSVRSAVRTSPVLDPRTIRLPVPDARARRLVFTVPENSEPVRVRTFRNLPDRVFDNDPLIGLGRRDAVRLARRIGRESWSQVDHVEALALASQRWEAMRPLYGTNTPVTSTITNVVDPAMPAQVRRAASVTLPEGRSIAWRVQGPVDAMIVAKGDVEQLALEAVAHDHGPAPLSVEIVDAPPWAAESKAIRVRSDATTIVSLHVHHSGEEELHDMLLITRGPPADVLPPDVEAAPLNSLLPDPTDPTLLAVIPSRLAVGVELLHRSFPQQFMLPASPGSDVVRLTLRGLRNTPEMGEDATVHARITHQDGRIDERVLTVPFTPSTFERAGISGDAVRIQEWVGEPEQRYVHLGPGATMLELSADQRILLSAHSPGAPHGSARSLSPTERTRSRYARSVESRWVRLTPINNDPSLPQWQLWGNTREETMAEEEPIGETPRMRSATFHGDADRTWLIEAAGPNERDLAAAQPLPMVPSLAIHGKPTVDTGQLAPASLEGMVYCGFSPSERTQPFPYDRHAIHQTGGFLAAVLWAPRSGSGPRLGDPWSLSVDGASWVQGRVRTEVERRRGHRPPTRHITFTGPRGARLWLRTWLEPGESCASPRRPRATRHLRPGQTTRFVVDRTIADHLVFIGGLGEHETPLRVRVVAGHADPSKADNTAWTRRTRTLTLLPGDPRQAIAIDQPWLTRPSLQGAGMRLGADLPLGPTTLEVHHMGTHPVELFVLFETTEAGTPNTTVQRGRR